MIIVFDFDGTIANNLKQALNLANQIAVELNLKQIKYSPRLRSKTLKQIIRENVPIYILPTLILKMRKKMEEMPIKPVKGIMPVVRTLNKKFPTYILTSSSKSSVNKIVNKEDVREVIGKAPLFGKELALKKLIKQTNENPKNIILIGDETRDIEAAKKAGVTMISVSWGFNNKKTLKKYRPDYIASTPKEILRIIKRIESKTS